MTRGQNGIITSKKISQFEINIFEMRSIFIVKKQTCEIHMHQIAHSLKERRKVSLAQKNFQKNAQNVRNIQYLFITL